MGNQSGNCCEPFNPAPWDEKEITWNDRLFVKDRVRNFFHVPLNFGQVVKKNMELIGAANALEEPYLALSDEKSLFGSDLHIAVSKEVPGAKMEKISGTFFTKVFEGPFKNCGKWAKETAGLVKSKGKELKKLYFFYTTCPKCAEASGKNYVVVLAQI